MADSSQWYEDPLILMQAYRQEYFRRAKTPQIPGYESIKEIARGAQGIVYQALQRSTKRLIAIKVLSSPSASESDHSRFTREVKSISRLQHPNIVQVYDGGSTDDGRMYFVMEHIAGVPLSDQLRDKRPAGKHVPTANWLHTFAQICDAVRHAHERGVIHRDLKPSNIRIAANGQPYLLDFGLASEVGELSELTASSHFIGSLHWASPEQIEGFPDGPTIQTDVYSLCVILYQMLTGRFPYDMSGSIRDRMNKILQDEPIRPSRFTRRFPNDLETILLKGLAKDPPRRYKDAGELAADIRRYLAGDAIRAKQNLRLYVAWKMFRKHWIASIASICIFSSGLGGVAVLAQARSDEAHQRMLANEREKEARLANTALESVTIFQRNMLTASPPDQVGYYAITDLTWLLKEGMRLSGKSDVEVDRATRELQELLSWVSYPDLGRRVIDQSVLGPASLRARAEFANQPAIRYRVHKGIGGAYRHLGMYKRAQEEFTTATELAQAIYGKEHEQTLDCMSDMAGVLLDDGEGGEAESLLKQAIAMSERSLGHDHDTTRACLANLGVLYRRSGRLKDAEAVFVDLLKKSNGVNTNEPADAQDCKHNLAAVYLNQERSEEAGQLLEPLLEQRERELGKEHEKTLATMHNLGTAYHRMNQLRKAELIMTEVLEIKQRIFGEEHKSTLVSMTELAQLFVDLNRLEQAEELFETALNTQRRILGDNHPDTVSSINQKAMRLKKRGQHEEAERNFVAALEGFHRLWGEYNLDSATVANNLATLHRDKKRFKEAVPLFREAMNARRSLLGEAHEKTLHSKTNLAFVMLRLGDFQSAQELYTEVIDQRGDSSNETSVGLGVALAGLGECLYGLESYEKAENALLQAYHILHDLRGEKDALTARPVVMLAKLYDTIGSSAEAEKWRSKLTAFSARR